MEMTKILIDKAEYDDLVRKEMRLEMIRRAMVDNLDVYELSGFPFLKSDFLSVLKVVFPFDYTSRLREITAHIPVEGGEQ